VKRELLRSADNLASTVDGFLAAPISDAPAWGLLALALDDFHAARAQHEPTRPESLGWHEARPQLALERENDRSPGLGRGLPFLSSSARYHSSDMAFGKKTPQFSGPDYLIGAAQHIMEAGSQNRFVRPFQEMVMTAVGPEFMPGQPLDSEYMAKRRLKDFEAAAVAVIKEAGRVAALKKDWRGLDEILSFGAAMAVRFEEYLRATQQPD